LIIAWKLVLLLNPDALFLQGPHRAAEKSIIIYGFVWRLAKLTLPLEPLSCTDPHGPVVVFPLVVDPAVVLPAVVVFEVVELLVVV
jgi:hypothetical protein